MLVEVEGIIVIERSYSETSKLLTILTKEYGLINVMAKGAKGLKSALRSVTTKLTYAKFNIQYKKDKISTLINATIIDNLKNIKTDINKISYVSYIIELTSQVAKEHFRKELYDLLISAILKINDDYDGFVIMNIIELKYLDFLGVMPLIDECAVCGSKENIVTLSASAGGFVCKNCYHNDKIVSTKALKLIRAYYYVDISSLERINVSERLKSEINAFLDDYYERYTGLYLKSKEFVKNLKLLEKE